MSLRNFSCVLGSIKRESCEKYKCQSEQKVQSPAMTNSGRNQHRFFENIMYSSVPKLSLRMNFIPVVYSIWTEFAADKAMSLAFATCWFWITARFLLWVPSRHEECWEITMSCQTICRTCFKIPTSQQFRITFQNYLSTSYLLSTRSM